MIGGYSLSAFTKPLLAFAQYLGWPFILAMRIMDRTGKGLRTSARDALIADYTTESQRGRAFGLHRAMDSLGAVLGPLAALYFMSRMGQSVAAFRTVFLWAFVPAALRVLWAETVASSYTAWAATRASSTALLAFTFRLSVMGVFNSFPPV